MSSFTQAGRLAAIALFAMLLTAAFFTTPVLAEDYVYWADSAAKKIQRASVDDGVVEDLVILEGTQPLGIALDLAEGKVYWTECCDGDSVQRSDLDGSSIEQLLPNGDGDPSGGVASRTIDLDLTNRQLYVIDAFITGLGYRSNLDGTNVEETLPHTCDRAGVALDPAGGKMYMSCRSFHSIERANLDGTGITVLVTGLGDPRQIALDLDFGKLYWADAVGTIQRANLDGTGVEDVVTGLGFIHGLALDLQKGKIYWSVPGADKIQRADLDGSNIEDVVTGIPSPVEIALQLDVSEVSEQQMIEDLVSDVDGLDIGAGISNSLDKKLEAALDALADLNEKNKKNKAKAAIGSLGAFINAVEAQRGKQLTDEQADELIAAAQQIIDMLMGG